MWVVKVIPKVIYDILVQLEKNGFEAYIVGGFVRDSLLFKKTNDIDIATNALPKDLISIFGIPKRSIQYGSYHLKADEYDVDITTYRKEEAYTDGHPVEVIYSNNLIEDAPRRDFTMNSLYMNKKGHIIDLYHGQDDISKKIIRMIGKPKDRLEEDPIRILRAIRFSCVYHMKFDSSLYRAIESKKNLLKDVSAPLIKRELDAILLANGFPLLKKMGLLGVLGIQNKKIVYVEDISGLWAQIKTDREYIIPKELKYRQKRINNILKCGTIKMFDLYQYGYYECRVAASIMHFPFKKLAYMNSILPINSRKDIVLSSEEIKKISEKSSRELGELINKIEYHIVMGDLLNKREDIIKFIRSER